MHLFDGVRYFLSSSLSEQRCLELSHVLDNNGAIQVAAVDDDALTHVISNSNRFEGWQNVSAREEAGKVVVVTDKWVDRSMLLGRLQSTMYYSADPAMIFSGVVACAAELSASDQEVLSAGITALGGQWRTGLTRDVTHLFAISPSSPKYATAFHFQEHTHIKVLLPHWFDDAVRIGMGNLDTAPYEWPDPVLLRMTPTSLTAREGATAAGVQDAEKETTKKLALRKVDAEKKTLYRTASLWDTDAPLQELPTASGSSAVSNAPNVAQPKDIWQGRRILLGLSLELSGGRRDAVVAGIERAGGVVIGVEEGEGKARELELVDESDVFVTKFRSGKAYVRAVRLSKTIGTLPWIFHVHSTGVLSPPMDQLLFYPIPRRPIEGFSGHEITVTNYTGQSREYLKKLITAMGATFTPSMTGKNTILIAAYISGNKTTKAASWSIPIVNHTWLEDCFVKWRNLTPAVEKYIVFPAGIDFAALLGERGVGRAVEESITEDELLLLEAEEEEEEAELRKEEKEVEAVEKHVQEQRDGVLLGTESSAKDAREVEDRVREEVNGAVEPIPAVVDAMNIEKDVETDSRSPNKDANVRPRKADSVPRVSASASTSPVKHADGAVGSGKVQKSLAARMHEKEMNAGTSSAAKTRVRKGGKKENKYDDAQEEGENEEDDEIDETPRTRSSRTTKADKRAKKGSPLTTPVSMKKQKGKGRTKADKSRSEDEEVTIVRKKSGKIATVSPARGKKQAWTPETSSEDEDVRISPVETSSAKKSRVAERRREVEEEAPATSAGRRKLVRRAGETSAKASKQLAPSEDDMDVDEVANDRVMNRGPTKEGKQTRYEVDEDEDEEEAPSRPAKAKPTAKPQTAKRRKSGVSAPMPSASADEVEEEEEQEEDTRDRVSSVIKRRESGGGSKKGKKRVDSDVDMQSEEEEVVVSKKRISSRRDRKVESDEDVEEAESPRRLQKDVKTKAAAAKQKKSPVKKTVLEEDGEQDEERSSRKKDIPNVRVKPPPKRPLPKAATPEDEKESDVEFVEAEKPVRKANAKGKAREQSEDEEPVKEKATPKPRPKPRPVHASSSKVATRRVNETDEDEEEKPRMNGAGRPSPSKSSASAVPAKKTPSTAKKMAGVMMPPVSSLTKSALSASPSKRSVISTPGKPTPSKLLARTDSVRVSAAERSKGPPSSPAVLKQHSGKGKQVARDDDEEDEEDESAEDDEEVVRKPPPKTKAKVKLPDDHRPASSSPLPALASETPELDNPTRYSSKRNAATKASQKLRDEIMPDVVNFQNELRNQNRRKSGGLAAIGGPALGEPSVPPSARRKRAPDVNGDEAKNAGAEREKKRRRVSVDETSDAEDDMSVVVSVKGKAKATQAGNEAKKSASKGTRGAKASRDDEVAPSDSSKPTIRLMTTQVNLGEDVVKALTRLGVKMTTRPAECTHLLVPHLVRTEKFLCALAVAPYILTEKWAVDSAASKKLLDEKSYFLNDKANEQKYNFALADALERARELKGKLFAGHTFYVTPKVPIDIKLLKNVVFACGGQISTQTPTLRIIDHNPQERHVISCQADISIWRSIAQQHPIYSQELILMAALKQEAEWDNTSFRIVDSS